MNSKSYLLKKLDKWKKRYFNKGFKSRVAPYLVKNHLDFGCGFGGFAYLLAKDFPKVDVYGVDDDKEKISLGKKNYKRKNLYLISSKEVRGEYDSISCFFVVHHLGEKYLKEFYKHLNPNGKIIIFDFRKVSKKEFEYWYEKKTEIGEYKESFAKAYRDHNKWSVKEFCSLMKKIGFKTILSEEAGGNWFWYVGEKY